MKTAAIVTIRNGHKMSPKGVKDVALWLRRQAAWFEKHNKELAPTFRAKFRY